MKRNYRNSIVATSVLLLLLLVTACTKHGDHSENNDTYTCPMHPTVIADKPGACPVCGMDLVRKARAGEAVEITEELSGVIKSPNEAIVASIKTIKGEFKTLAVSLEAQGMVTYDERSIYSLPSRVSGRLDKVFLKYPFQEVKKGQKVAEIYSPDLVAAQRELLFLLENDSNNEDLINSARQRLSLLGASDSQIDNLIKRKEPQNSFSIYSPYEGYVISPNQQAPKGPVVSTLSQGSGMSNDMSGGSSSASTASSNTIANENLIREGSYAAAGQTLFKMVNPASLRVELNVPATLSGAISKGTKATLDFGNGDKQSATVDFVQPFFSEGQEFLTVRVFTHHTEKLHIGHLVTAVLSGNAIEALWVPQEAVVDLGVDKVVFIKDRKSFKPKKITTGVRTQGLVEIKLGLSTADEIASNAHYLIDSESFIKTQP
jgi:membrane fusion protein, copper/silver efflux system